MEKVKILFINVHTQSTAYGKVIQHIENINPDVLALEEINQKWFHSLSAVLDEFPYRQYVLREDNFGIGLFSKIKPRTMSVQYYGEAGVPSILSNFSFKDKSIDILFTHPVPPASRHYFRLRNNQLAAIASLRSQFSDNLIVVGDLNTTSWSYAFKTFLAQMRLKDSRRGFGIQNSWPTMIPALGIAIDHCLISDSISVLKRSTGPYLGPDHYPVFVELGMGQ